MTRLEEQISAKRLYCNVKYICQLEDYSIQELERLSGLHIGQLKLYAKRGVLVEDRYIRELAYLLAEDKEELVGTVLAKEEIRIHRRIQDKKRRAM